MWAGPTEASGQTAPASADRPAAASDTRAAALAADCAEGRELGKTESTSNRTSNCVASKSETTLK
jgi:hypothetical protein